MAKFVKREWVAGDQDFGATELNRMENGIEEAINLASLTPEVKAELEIEECTATTVKGVVDYINELVVKLKAK